MLWSLPYMDENHWYSTCLTQPVISFFTRADGFSCRKSALGLGHSAGGWGSRNSAKSGTDRTKRIWKKQRHDRGCNLRAIWHLGARWPWMHSENPLDSEWLIRIIRPWWFHVISRADPSRSPQVPGIGPLPMPENGRIGWVREVNRVNKCQRNNIRVDKSWAFRDFWASSKSRHFSLDLIVFGFYLIYLLLNQNAKVINATLSSGDQ